jgi:sulfatase modifying factor 1
MQVSFWEIAWIFLCISPISLYLASRDCFQEKFHPSVKEPENLSGESCSASGHEGMVLVKGGIYEIGTDEPVFIADGESPARSVYLDDYFIDKHEVSNQDFAEFVKISNFVTDAEKFGSSFVFEGILSDETKSKISKVVASAPWWMPVTNASWKFPEGLTSSISGFPIFFYYSSSSTFINSEF